MDGETYGPAEVCLAAGVPRATFHSWVARKYLPLPPGPGMGRERRFTMEEAIKIAITAELTRLGLSVGSAAHAADLLPRLRADGHRPSISDDGWKLLIIPAAAPAGVDSSTLRPLGLVRAESPAALQKHIDEQYGHPKAVVIADVSAIARQTIERLKGPSLDSQGAHGKS